MRGERGRRSPRRSARLDELTRRLRRECPWDREQDERTIVPHTVEEAYELADAANRGDDAKLLDELGDVLFQVHFLSLLLEERGAGDLAAVAEHCRQKLIRRHPHVFGEVEARTGAARCSRNWDQIKRGRGGPRARPLRRRAGEPARRCCTRARSSAGPRRRLRLRRRRGRARAAHESSRLEAAETPTRLHELGDVLFAAVNVARKLQVDPSSLCGRVRSLPERVTTANDLLAELGAGELGRRQLAYYASRATS